ncbi:hypothetical protein J7295_04282 [Nakaseomyces glabratus]|nr:hypothetical protein J7298_04322 [Nakaseomyces glabratus]KAH7595059.1 hypothetical protein J7295_04282 [Nakaseomyces glabratus]KAH7611143.1 hypothetical protein J7292_04293 [Nakaseomyces glabratus]
MKPRDHRHPITRIHTICERQKKAEKISEIPSVSGTSAEQCRREAPRSVPTAQRFLPRQPIPHGRQASNGREAIQTIKNKVIKWASMSKLLAPLYWYCCPKKLCI